VAIWPFGLLSDIMATLPSIGKPINSLDVLIAGIAVANGAEKPVTKDRDFENIAKVAEIEVILLGVKNQTIPKDQTLSTI